MDDEMTVAPRGPLTGQEPPAPAVPWRQLRPVDERLREAVGRLSTALQRLRAEAGPELTPAIDEVTGCLFMYAAEKARAAREEAAAAHQRPAGWRK